MLSFIFIYSLFLSIPLPYLSQPPLGSCPISRDRPAHQPGGLGDVPAPDDVSASPALTRPLDTLLFPFSLPWKGFPPSLLPFPAPGGVAESTAAGSWLRRAHRGAEVTDTSSSLHAGCPQETPLSLLPWGIFEAGAPWASSKELGTENRRQGGSFRGGNRPAG